MKNTGKNARFGAVETLVRLDRTRYPVKPLLDSVSDLCMLSSADRGLMMNLVYGTLRHRQFLDILIQKLSRTPLKKLDPVVRFGLHVGFYQLFFLDRIPESAAVNETVNAVKEAGIPKRLQGFVNGILRESIRKRNTLLQPDFSITNHPEWLTARWQKLFGKDEMLRICSINNSEPLLSLRTNTERASREALLDLFRENRIEAELAMYAPEGILLPDYHGPIADLPGYREGFFQPQDQAAQLATHLLAPFSKKGTYLDGCAGLGTKTCHLLQLTHDLDVRVTAVEPEPQRQRLFSENIDAFSPENAPIFQKTTLQEYCRTSRVLFSGIIIDAPCSGTGVSRRHPDIRWNRQPEELAKYQRQQLEILEHGAGLVTRNGILVYATCSLEPEENRDVVNTFLANNSDFHLTDCCDVLPEQAHRFVHEKCFAPKPERDIDGFFAARLQRTD